MAQELTQQKLKELLNYDPETGVFTWLVFRCGGTDVGDVAGTKDANGYVRFSVMGRKYLGHRLAWFYEYGVWPKLIDHKDRNPSNNRLDNLREATKTQNGQNRSDSSGVYFLNRKQNKKKPYVATISANGKSTHIGCFATFEEAAEARAKVKRLLHPFFYEEKQNVPESTTT